MSSRDARTSSFCAASAGRSRAPSRAWRAASRSCRAPRRSRAPRSSPSGEPLPKDSHILPVARFSARSPCQMRTASGADHGTRSMPSRNSSVAASISLASRTSCSFASVGISAMSRKYDTSEPRSPERSLSPSVFSRSRRTRTRSIGPESITASRSVSTPSSASDPPVAAAPGPRRPCSPCSPSLRSRPAGCRGEGRGGHSPVGPLRRSGGSGTGSGASSRERPLRAAWLGSARPDPESKLPASAGGLATCGSLRRAAAPQGNPNDVATLSAIRPDEIERGGTASPSNASNVWRIQAPVNGSMPRAMEFFS